MCREPIALARLSGLGRRFPEDIMQDTADSAGSKPDISSGEVEAGQAGLRSHQQNLPDRRGGTSRADVGDFENPEDGLVPTASGIEDQCGKPIVAEQLHEDVTMLRRRVAAAEAESARHIQIISSMHNWAAQAATSLRQVQEKCEVAESRAKSAEKEVESLRHQLSQVAAQVEAMAVETMPNRHNAATHGGAGDAGRRKKKRNMHRVGTMGSLAAPDASNLQNNHDQGN